MCGGGSSRGSQGQGHEVGKVGIIWKCLTEAIYMASKKITVQMKIKDETFADRHLYLLSI